MSYIIYVCDCETSGLSPVENDIIELSFCRFSLDSPEKSEQKTWCIKPMNPGAITEKALNVNKHKKEDILHLTKFGKETYLLPAEAISQIEGWILEDGFSVDDRVLAGQNIEFDVNFMKEFWRKTNSAETYPFGDINRNAFFIDTIAITRLIDVICGKKRDYYNLSALVKSFGITKKQAHTAAGDVFMTQLLFMKLIGPLQEIIKSTFKDNE